MLSARSNKDSIVEDRKPKRFVSSCMTVEDGHVHINSFSTLPEPIRTSIKEALLNAGVTPETIEGDIVRVPRQVSIERGEINMAAVLGKITGFVAERKLRLKKDIKKTYPDTLANAYRWSIPLTHKQ